MQSVLKNQLSYERSEPIAELGESIGKMLSEFKKAVKGTENQDKEE